MCNTDIRFLAKEKKVCLWEIARELGIADATFSRKLRFELPETEKNKIKKIIEELSK